MSTQTYFLKPAVGWVPPSPEPTLSAPGPCLLLCFPPLLVCVAGVGQSLPSLLPLPTAWCPVTVTVCSPQLRAEQRLLVEEAQLWEQEVGSGPGVGADRGPVNGQGMAGLSSHTHLPQELSNREVVAVGHLEVPSELARLLHAAEGRSALGGGGWWWYLSECRATGELGAPCILPLQASG